MLSSASIIENAVVFYLNTAASGNGIGISRSSAYLKASVDALNGSQTETMWLTDDNMINNGYPVLKWQKGQPAAVNNAVVNGTLIKAFYSGMDRSIIINSENACGIKLIDIA